MSEVREAMLLPLRTSTPAANPMLRTSSSGGRVSPLLPPELREADSHRTRAPGSGSFGSMRSLGSVGSLPGVEEQPAVDHRYDGAGGSGPVPERHAIRVSKMLDEIIIADHF